MMARSSTTFIRGHQGYKYWLGKHCSEQTKRKLSLALTGRKLPLEVKEKMKGRIPWCKGKHLSEEIRKKISESKKGVPHYVSVETGRRISKAKKGHFTSEETKEKIGRAHLGKKLTEEHKNKIGEASVMIWKNPELRRMIVEKLKKRTFSESHRQKISEKLLGRKLSKESRIKIREARLKQVLPKRDTKPERVIQQLLKQNAIEFLTHIQLTGQPDVFISPNLCIFIDGEYWHNNTKQRYRDLAVTSKLEEQGYHVLRFTDKEIYNSPKQVLEMILNHA